MPDERNSVQSPFANQTLPTVKLGKVSLVGAGPGDPGLITVRGVELLNRADVVLFDALANQQLLQHAPHAEWVSVGKHGGERLWSQDEINQRLVSLAKSGKQVVRLKGGDPAVFARTADELEVLSTEGIPFEVVPGITAALAASSYVGIPLTHRDHASAVALITGQQQDAAPQTIDWHSLAQFPGTLVFYMGVTSASEWTSKLLQAGMGKKVPAAIVRRCTWGDQLVIRCPLSDVAKHLDRASGLRPPIIVIVGAVAGLGEKYDWFSKRPLSGIGVLVTRPQSQASALASHLEELGAAVYCQAAIRICPPTSFEVLDRGIHAIVERRYWGITFSSANGIDAFFNRLYSLGLDSRALAGCRVAVVGAKTAEHLRRFGLKADIVPTDFGARGLVSVLGPLVRGQRLMAVLADQSQPALVDGLKSYGAEVDAVVSYYSQPVSELDNHIRQAIERGRIQWVTITSPLIARATASMLGDYITKLHPVSLSPEISAELQLLGWPAAAGAVQPTDEHLVAALVQHVATRNSEPYLDFRPGAL